MRQHLVVLAASLSALAITLGAACSRIVTEASGGAGSSAESSRTVSASGSTGSHSTGTTSTGAGGVGGAGADPIWAPIPNPPLGCAMDRVVNPAEVRWFTWKPCDGVADCEQMVLSPYSLATFSDGIAIGGTVHEELGQTFAILRGGSTEMWQVVFANQDGWGLEAYRAPTGTAPYVCLLYTGSATVGHDGALMMKDNWGSFGGVVHAFGDASDPIPFTFEGGSPGANGISLAMTSGRWTWAGFGVVSIATPDATDFSTVNFGDPTSTLLGVDSLDTNGSTFMIGERRLVAGGGVTGLIATTDGKSPPTPYVVPSDNSVYDSATYAGDYIAWLRGIGTTNGSDYDKVEVWASLYNPDPTKLVPFKVTDYSYNGMTPLLGAGGRIAYQSSNGSPTVWNLATLTQALYTLPADELPDPPLMGITSTHLWVRASPPPAGESPTNMIVRYALH